MTIVQRAIADSFDGTVLTTGRLLGGEPDAGNRTITLEKLASDMATVEVDEWPTRISERIAALR